MIRRMIKVTQVEIIRGMWMNGKSKTEIAHALSMDRKTVGKYIDKEDFSQDVDMQANEQRTSKLDPYKKLILEKLEEEGQWFHKQRFTAIRMHSYLCNELGFEELRDSYQLIQRFMRHSRSAMKRKSYEEGGTMPLVWHPGEAQCDFGEADFYDESGKIVRLKSFIMSFPYSNGIVSAVLPGENCQCVCQGLFWMFKALDGVPFKIVLDNATGIGHRVCSRLVESEEFTRFRMHYGFRAVFTNPYAGYEKGCVENAVGAFRRNAMVPPLRIEGSLEEYNLNVMIPLSLAFRTDSMHYRKNAPIGKLFCEDRKALLPLTGKPFRISRITRHTLNNVGRGLLDGKHSYVLGPGHSNETIIVEKTAWEVIAYDLGGKRITSFDRCYGPEDEESFDLPALLSFMPIKGNSWPNSIVRERMSDGPFKSYLDQAGSRERQNALFMFSSLTDEYGFGNACCSLNRLAGNGHAPSRDDAKALCERITKIPAWQAENPTGVDLSPFDALLAGMLREA